MFDSFGDGWDGSTVGISINGGPYTNYTVTGTSNSVVFGVNIGDIITIQYTGSSPWPGEISYMLSLGGGLLFSDGPNPTNGVVYSAIVDCIQPPPVQEDCIGAVTICSNVSIANNTNNTGAIADINFGNSGCLDPVENQGTWYIFSPSSGGDLGLSINPLGPDDYDWAVWGPYPSGSALASICPPAGPPIRCAASSGPATFANTGSYATGMGHAVFSPPQFATTAVSYGIPATTNICPLIAPQRCGWVPGMQVVAGEIYLLYISNWTNSSIGFDMDWILENGASLDCTVLPVELLTFEAYAIPSAVKLEWSTGSELNSDHFDIERSSNGSDFESIGVVAAAGSSFQTQHYDFTDEKPYSGLNYYRLRQVDIDGEFEYSPVRTVRFTPSSELVHVFPNPGTTSLEVVSGAELANTRLILLDATGRMVLDKALWSSRNIIDVSTLAPGLFVYQIVDADQERMSTGTWIKE